MPKAISLHTAYAFVLLAASPAVAQSNTPTGNTGAGGVPNAPTTREAMPGQVTPKANSVAGPQDKSSTNRVSMGQHRSAGTTHSAKATAAPDTEVEQLNQGSYQAAQQGQSFSPPITGSNTATPTASGTSGAPAPSHGKM